MSQVSVFPGTAHGRSSWRALRPLLILGGFVAVWWALMTGVAHADDTPRHSVLDQVRSTAKAHHAAPVKDQVKNVVRKSHQAVEVNASKATADVREVVQPVTQKVTSVVQSTPVVREVTATATAAVSQTVAKTRDVLEKAPAGPVVDPVLEPVDDDVHTATPGPESSTGQGDPQSTSTSGTSAATQSDLAAQQLPDSLGTSGHEPSTSDGVEPSEDGSPLDGPLGHPSAPGPCASPSGSGSTSSTPVGTLEPSLLAVPSVLRDTHTWRHARLPGGPAYEPGSSPD